MPTEWARTETGDMYFPPNGQGADALVSDLATVAAIKIPSVLEFVLGEWKLDQSLGFPWQQIWAQKNPLLPQLQALFRKAILAITINSAPLVATVTDVSIALNTRERNLSYSVSCTLVNGQEITVPA
jgi:hypothetical protein